MLAREQGCRLVAVSRAGYDELQTRHPQVPPSVTSTRTAAAVGIATCCEVLARTAGWEKAASVRAVARRQGCRLLAISRAGYDELQTRHPQVAHLVTFACAAAGSGCAA